MLYMYILILSQTIVKYLYTVYVYCGNECFSFEAELLYIYIFIYYVYIFIYIANYICIYIRV